MFLLQYYNFILGFFILILRFRQALDCLIEVTCSYVWKHALKRKLYRNVLISHYKEFFIKIIDLASFEWAYFLSKS